MSRPTARAAVPDNRADPAVEVSGRLNEMLRQLKHLHAEVATRIGEPVELPASAVMAALNDHRELRMSALAEILRLDLSSVSRQVAGLERVGWVGRRRDPGDQRASLLQLTPEGTRVITQIRSERTAVLREVFAEWSPGDLTAFAESLERFSNGLASRPSTRRATGR